MERLARNVTKKFIALLPDQKSFFTPDDLRKFDIPEFVIQRVEVEIYRNLNESIVPPQTEWANMEAGNVEKAWEQFINAILEEVRMPASYASSVFETALGDLFDLILKPRNAVPAILFGPRKTLTRKELEKNAKSITVQTHLSTALLKYVERKDKNELDFETCKRVVEQIDNRLTQNYNSLNWAQLLQPLFILAGPDVDTELFRIFFEDKGMKRLSRKFDALNGSLNKKEFIEVMSSPDLLDEDNDDDKLSFYEQKLSQQENIQPDEPDEKEKDEDFKKELWKFSEENNSGQESDLEQDDSILSTFQNRLRSGESSEEDTIPEVDTEKFVFEDVYEVEDEEDKDEEPPLHQEFASEESEEDENRETETDDSLEKQFKQGDDDKILIKDFEPEEPETNLNSLDPDEYEFKPSEDQTDADEEDNEEIQWIEEETDEGNDVEDRPIWQAFLENDENVSEDEIEIDSAISSGTVDEEGFIDEPLIDLTQDDEEVSNIESISAWLKDEEERFTNGIFSGSAQAYEQALTELEGMDNWKQATHFIENEIFVRNLVDMYDDVAVDFTDRLQDYFDEFKSVKTKNE